LVTVDATTTAVEAQSMIMPIINKVYYDIMHCHLEHPSKEVLKHAIANTKGFLEGIKIPTTSDVCPRCAQDKMPAASHPQSNKRAPAAFLWIPSDLNSFPIPSYHRYKYFIVFLVDYISHNG